MRDSKFLSFLFNPVSDSQWEGWASAALGNHGRCVGGGGRGEKARLGLQSMISGSDNKIYPPKIYLSQLHPYTYIYIYIQRHKLPHTDTKNCFTIHINECESALSGLNKTQLDLSVMNNVWKSWKVLLNKVERIEVWDMVNCVQERSGLVVTPISCHKGESKTHITQTFAFSSKVFVQ